ncbi:6998_t:CDS:2 [Diversispora eburnea]|uniref:6998_t:CDS:1 n=1 Tax=Diversispora eburnea TaxID=1213867 RepID=A0A9N8V0S4_9GLOM|nr:6998_t:CDS:2 [Diversispora eburnea]
MGQDNETEKIKENDLITDNSQHNEVLPVENVENKENIVKLEGKESKRMRSNSGTNSTNSEINKDVDVTTTSKSSSSPTSTNIEPRENFISQAVNFLSSPNVIKAEEEKKTQFLLMVPPRTYSPQTLPLVNVPPQKQIIGRPKIWKNLLYVLLFTGVFSVALITAIKKLLGPVDSITFSSEDKYEMLSSNPPSLLAPLSNDLSNLTERIHTHQKNVLKNEAMEDLQQSLTSLVTYLSANFHLLTNSWSVYGNGRYRNDPTAEQVKTEIRSIKGLLIGRSNFPKIPINRSSIVSQKVTARKS